MSSAPPVMNPATGISTRRRKTPGQRRRGRPDRGQDRAMPSRCSAWWWRAASSWFPLKSEHLVRPQVRPSSRLRVHRHQGHRIERRHQWIDLGRARGMLGDRVALRSARLGRFRQPTIRRDPWCTTAAGSTRRWSPARSGPRSGNAGSWSRSHQACDLRLRIPKLDRDASRGRTGSVQRSIISKARLVRLLKSTACAKGLADLVQVLEARRSASHPA